MLDPKSLRKKSEIALQKAEERRQQQERTERINKELSLLLEEYEKKKSILKHAHAQRVDRRIEEIICAAIGAALISSSSIKFITDPDETYPIVRQLISMGFNVTLESESKWRAKSDALIRGLIQELDNNPGADFFINQLSDDLLFSNGLRSGLIFILTKLLDSKEIFLNPAIQVLILNEILPYLSEGEENPDLHDTILVSWKSVDLRYEEAHEFHHAPSWIMSLSGNGLLNNIDKLLEEKANSGYTSMQIYFEKIPQNFERWGHNSMGKITHPRGPLGVCPFEPSMLTKILEAIGFNVECKLTDSFCTIDIEW